MAMSISFGMFPGQIFEKYWFINRVEFREHYAIFKGWVVGLNKANTGLKEALLK